MELPFCSNRDFLNFTRRSQKNVAGKDAFVYTHAVVVKCQWGEKSNAKMLTASSPIEQATSIIPLLSSFDFYSTCLQIYLHRPETKQNFQNIFLPTLSHFLLFTPLQHWLANALKKNSLFSFTFNLICDCLMVFLLF